MLITKSDGTPKQQGEAIGRAIRSRKQELSNVAKRLLLEEGGIDESEARRKVGVLFDALSDQAPEALAELEGVARGADWELTDCAVYNNWNYLIEPRSEGQACTARLALGEATRTGQPLLAKNKDYRYAFGAHMHGLNWATSTEGYSFVTYGVIGWVGCDNGVNEKGLAIVLTWCPTLNRGLGVQGHILTKLVLRNCATTPEALNYLQGLTRTGMTNYVLVDANGEAAVFENAHTQCGIRRPTDDGLLVCTNHFVAANMVCDTPPFDPQTPLSYVSTRTRYDRALALLHEAQGEIDTSGIIDVGRDHANGPSALSICAHGERNGIAAGSVGMFCSDPAEGKIHLVDGRPCRNEVQSFELPWANAS